jgi:hypothetical protein
VISSGDGEVSEWAWVADGELSERGRAEQKRRKSQLRPGRRFQITHYHITH